MIASIHGAILHFLATAAVAIVMVACTGTLTPNGEGGGGAGDPEHMEGAGGRDISEYWPSIDIPLSENTRMLSFETMKNEVERATGLTWEVDGVDQWARNRGALGGADYETTFSDDLTPSQQRIVLWRKMAFQVCGDLVALESGTESREVFAIVDPGASFDADGQATEDQIRSLFRRFFVADATDADVEDSRELLRAVSPTGSDGAAAWRGLCVLYLGSMRFLTY